MDLPVSPPYYFFFVFESCRKDFFSFWQFFVNTSKISIEILEMLIPFFSNLSDRKKMTDNVFSVSGDFPETKRRVRWTMCLEMNSKHKPTDSGCVAACPESHLAPTSIASSILFLTRGSRTSPSSLTRWDRDSFHLSILFTSFFWYQNSPFI